MADLIAEIDVLVSLSELADKNDYIRPIVHEDENISLVESRHPVVEKLITSERFIPNTLSTG